MTIQIKRYAAAEFDAITALPENADKLLELIGGEIVEAPSNPYSSELAATISFFIKLYLREHGLPGHVTGEAGGYRVEEERYAPDVAFVSQDKQPKLPSEGYNPSPPDLAVEVVSPSAVEKRLRFKIANYLAAGTLVWVVYPQTKEVEIYTPGQRARIVGIGEILDGGETLPGFALPVKDIFPAE